MLLDRRKAIAGLGMLISLGLCADTGFAEALDTTTWGVGNLLIDCPTGWTEIVVDRYDLCLKINSSSRFGVIEDVKLLGITKKSIERAIKEARKIIETNEDMVMEHGKYKIVDIDGLEPTAFVRVATVPFAAENRYGEPLYGSMTCLATDAVAYITWAFGPDNTQHDIDEWLRSILDSATYREIVKDVSYWRKLLEKAVDKALTLNVQALSSDVRKDFDAALAHAQEVLQDVNATADSLKSALKELEIVLSIAALVAILL